MNKDFPRIMTFLRKERGLSQKQAAADLGVSQALLSHYEKGIRELGRTVQRNLSTVSENAESDDIRHLKGNMINQINRKLLMNTTTIVYDLLAQMGSKRLTNAVSNYLMCAEYQVFRTIYSAEKSNEQSMFSLDKSAYKNLTASHDARFEDCRRGDRARKAGARPFARHHFGIL